MSHIYEVRPRKDKRGVDLISDELPFGRVWYAEATQPAAQSDTRSTALDYIARSSGFMMLRGNVIQTHEHAGEFKES